MSETRFYTDYICDSGNKFNKVSHFFLRNKPDNMYFWTWPSFLMSLKKIFYGIVKKFCMINSILHYKQVKYSNFIFWPPLFKYTSKYYSREKKNHISEENLRRNVTKFYFYYIFRILYIFFGYFVVKIHFFVHAL